MQARPLTSASRYHRVMTKISDLRTNYQKGHLEEDQAGKDPFTLFKRWLDEAITLQIPGPTAMTVATVSAEGRPSTRVVLLKDFDSNGLVWYTNYNSRKGQHLAASPYAALQFHWVEMERVVRIEGSVTRTTSEESDVYFQSRPLQSRIGAWASPQSEVVNSRATLMANAAGYAAKFLLHPPRPPHWGGYRLSPNYWEFWQGRESRLHDRLRYTPTDQGDWAVARLAP